MQKNGLMLLRRATYLPLQPFWFPNWQITRPFIWTSALSGWMGLLGAQWNMLFSHQTKNCQRSVIIKRLIMVEMCPIRWNTGWKSMMVHHIGFRALQPRPIHRLVRSTISSSSGNLAAGYWRIERKARAGPQPLAYTDSSSVNDTWDGRSIFTPPHWGSDESPSGTSTWVGGANVLRA